MNTAYIRCDGEVFKGTCTRLQYVLDAIPVEDLESE